jgi:hypothetical protein
MRKRSLVSLLAGLCILGSMGAGPCVNKGPNFFGFLAPAANLLTTPGGHRVEVLVPAFARKETLQVLLNGADVTASFAWNGRVAAAQLAIADGPQHLEATIEREFDFQGTAATDSHFEAVTLASMKVWASWGGATPDSAIAGSGDFNAVRMMPPEKVAAAIAIHCL